VELQIPVYCDYEMVKADRALRRNRLMIKIDDDAPLAKRKRSVSNSSSESSEHDYGVMQRQVFVVSSGSEGDGSPDSKQRLTIRQEPPPFVKNAKPDIGRQGNYDKITRMRQMRPVGSPMKDSAPSIGNHEIKSKVHVEIMKGGYANKNYARLDRVIEICSMVNFTRPGNRNPTVQVGIKFHSKIQQN